MQGINTQEKSIGVSDSLVFPLQPYLCYFPGDLREEFSYLKAKVFPLLDALCQTRGTCFKPVDLQQSRQERGYENNDSDGHQIKPDLFDQQLKISLDLIDRSSFFICLLGHSYGQCLPEENYSQSDIGPCSLSEVARNMHVAAKAGYPWVMEDRYRTCSLTELEITKAAFIDNHRSCFFYFKDYTPQDIEDDSSDEMHIFLNMLSNQSQSERQRIRDLKRRIINHCLPVRFFRNLHELEEMIRVDWEGVICKFHEDPKKSIIGWQQDSFDRHYHERHAHGLCDWFVPSGPTTEILNALNKFLHSITHNAKSEKHRRNPGAHFTCDVDQKDSEKSILLVCGERGCGKSTLAAWWLRAFCRQNPDFPVIAYFCGTSTSSTDVRSMLRQCTAQLRRAHYGDFPDWEDVIEAEYLHRAVQAFMAAANLGPCIILVDGIDLLTETLGLSKQEVKALQWLPDALPPFCKMIITTTFTDLTYKSLTSRTDVQILSCPRVSDPSVQQSILLRHLALPDKELPTSVLQKIACKKQCHLPAFLALMGTELRTCAVLREKDQEMELLEDYVKADSVPELWVKVIHRWVKDFSRTAPTEVTETHTSTASLSDDLSGWVWDTLCLIHVSRAGLTEAQVLALLEDLGYCGNLRVKVLEWARLRSAFWPWVQEKDNGLLTIMHQSLSQAMNLLLHGTEGQNSCHQILANFFQKSGLELCSWARKVEEIPWHLKQTGSFDELQDFLSDPAIMEFLSSSLKQYPQMTTDVVHYWTLLREKGFDYVTLFQNQMAQTLEHLNDAQPPDYSSVWRLSLFCCKVLLCLGEMQQAEELLLKADHIVQIKGMELDSDSMSLLLKVQHMLAELYIQMHLLKNSEMYCHKGLETARSLTVAHPDSAEVKLIVGQLLCRLCLALLADGRLCAVPGLFKEIRSSRYISVHPCAEGTAMLLKAIYKLSLCEPKTAEKCFQAALASRRRWYGHDNPLVAEVEEQLADLWASVQTYTEWTQRKIVELYRHAISTKENEARTLLPTAQLNLAVLLMKLGKVLLRSCSRVERREGLDLLQRAADIRIHLLGPEQPKTRDLEQST